VGGDDTRVISFQELTPADAGEQGACGSRPVSSVDSRYMFASAASDSPIACTALRGGERGQSKTGQSGSITTSAGWTRALQAWFYTRRRGAGSEPRSGPGRSRPAGVNGQNSCSILAVTAHTSDQKLPPPPPQAPPFDQRDRGARSARIVPEGDTLQTPRGSSRHRSRDHGLPPQDRPSRQHGMAVAPAASRGGSAEIGSKCHRRTCTAGYQFRRGSRRNSQDAQGSDCELGGAVFCVVAVKSGGTPRGHRPGGSSRRCT